MTLVCRTACHWLSVGEGVLNELAESILVYSSKLAMPLAELCATNPESCGVHSGRMQKLFAHAQNLVRDGVVDACSIAICRNGQLAGATAIGRDPQGRAVRSDSLFHMYSSTKVLVVRCQHAGQRDSYACFHPTLVFLACDIISSSD